MLHNVECASALTTAVKIKHRSATIMRIDEIQRLMKMPLIRPAVKHAQNKLPSAAACAGVVRPRIVAYAGTHVPTESSAIQ